MTDKLKGSHGFKSVRFAASPIASRSLTEWSEELRVPIGTILYHSIQGHFLAFKPISWDAPFCSISVSNHGTSEPAPAEVIKMSVKGAFGLVLTSEDLTRLTAGARIRTSQFHALIRSNSGWPEIVHPIPGRWDSTHADTEWRIGIVDPTHHDKEASTTPSFYELPINLSNLHVLDQEMEVFRERVYRGQFISDLFSDSKITEELPPYVSVKLQELIDANRLFWRNYASVGAEEQDRRRTQMREYLEDEFVANCHKTTSEEGLLEHAVLFADPTDAHESKRLEPPASATESLLMLLTAAKLFWEPHLACNYSYETYPDRKAMADFLRFIGMSRANAAAAGVTIIRPEGINEPAKPKKGRASILNSPRQPSSL